ncbi:hypothetical protein KHA80_05825 [Anaerobacillus sp. HL2]|nr:hypothetical protein KHA80_05825 [Anaerobacillus sp. HL2]
MSYQTVKILFWAKSLNKRRIEEIWNNPNLITISIPVTFKDDPYQYILTASTPLQPID